jgi:hypothetical protein
MAPGRVPLSVTAGASLERDIALTSSSPSAAARAGEVVKLDSFVTSVSREMDGAAIAINEQRFAAIRFSERLSLQRAASVSRVRA